MKKIIFSICLAALAVGCTKTEVNYTEPDQIAFAPVASNVTKAALGAGAVPTSDLIVSAFAGESDDQTTYTDPYFKNVQFTDSDKDGVFEATGYFWPNVKKLTFAGITKSAGFNTTLDPASSVSIYDAASTNDADKFILYNYYQTHVGAEHNDLMWFDRTAPAGKPTANDTEAKSVTMHHACSWLVFKFKGDGTAANTKRPWKITEVKIVGLAKYGTVTLAPNFEWEVSSTTADFLVDDTETALSATYTPKPTSIIVIPQTPAKLSVTYNYVSQFGPNDNVETDDIVITETAVVDLDFAGTAKWQAGTKYTYDITLTATGIKLVPKASTWVDYDSDTTNKDDNDDPIIDNIPETI